MVVGLFVLGKGVFGRFDLAALGGCHTLNVCYVMLTCARRNLIWGSCKAVTYELHGSVSYLY